MPQRFYDFLYGDILVLEDKLLDPYIVFHSDERRLNQQGRRCENELSPPHFRRKAGIAKSFRISGLLTSEWEECFAKLSGGNEAKPNLSPQKFLFQLLHSMI